MKYICQVCGYVYDEEQEGVKFEDLPEDFACPLCAVGKDQFEAEQVRLCKRIMQFVIVNKQIITQL